MTNPKLREVYQQAKAKPPQERAMFLLFNCGGDDAMRLEIQKMLDSENGAAAPVDPARRDRMRAIYDRAVTLPAHERASYVREACGEDEAMSREIEQALPWDRAAYVREVFAHALNLPPEQRDSYLSLSCRDDETMRSEILRMLQAYEQPAQPDRQTIMRDIFSRAMALPAQRREAYVKQACENDPQMASEIVAALPKPDRGALLRQTFDAAKTLPAELRDGYLREACANDMGMRVEVLRMLEASEPKPDRQAILRDIFSRAMALPAQQREAYVKQACETDPQMANEIVAALPKPDRGALLRQVFDVAKTLPADQRDGYLREACANDMGMPVEVRRMLEASEPKPDRQAILRDVFARAMALPAQQREAFIRRACAADAQMGDELLAALPKPEPSEPKPDRATIMRDIYSRTMTLPAEQREAFVQQACQGDPQMFNEIVNALPKPEPPQPAEDRFAQMRKIFDSAMTKPIEQRDAFLRFACGGDESMRSELSALVRAQADAGTFLQTPAQAQAQATQTIGPYRIIRELGRGGMGVVYLGMRDDGAFRKAVALKVLRGDQVTQDFLRRFREERQTLANLDHPYIARILDGGDLPDGMPYYVMDFIEGLPLDEYCDKNKLSITDRIKLFQKMCEAVDYLHTNRVVHRDLKPANILVGNDGAPKLLDFGIAKQQGNPDLTAAQERLLTPGYASPEQIYGGQVTGLSDIYTLGVILYFMLTGQLPYDDPHAKVANIMAGIDPPKPSTRIREDLQRTPETTQQLRKRIIGDLDNIVLMALRRDPNERYATARELAEDLQRYLDGRSVLARKDSIVERGMKFVRRNRIPVSIAAVLFLALGFGTWQTLQARMLASRAEEREAQIRGLLDLLDASGRPQPNRPGGAAPPPQGLNPGGGATGNRIDQVRRLRRAFETDFAAAWSARPGFTPERQQLMDRSIRYLDSMRPYCAQDPDLAIEVASAYQQIGLYQDNPQYGNRNAAVGTFNNAILLLNGVAGGNPNDPRVQGQMMFLVGRVRALGGSIPVYASMPMGGQVLQPQPQQPVEPRRAPVEAAPPPPRETIPEIQPPPSNTAATRQEYNDLKERLITVTSKIQIAEDSIAPIKQNVAAQGHTLHPDVLAAMTRMHMALDTAKREIAQNDWESARSSLNIAEANANRVLKFIGR
jgi:serine/threonine protein kinase